MSNLENIFEGRRVVIATQHQKERVIGPILEEEFGLFSFVPIDFDTDLLGTFSGEVERKMNPLETVRQKCLMAMEATDCDLGIASEGSFGPHPSLFFISADEEWLILIDKKNNLEIVVRELSTQTNFNGMEVTSEKQLLDFAESVQFPSHALILRKSKEEASEIAKGINDFTKLKEVFNSLFEKYNRVYAETDMRAMHNPSRMRVIENATSELVKRMQSLCPECKTPGFSITDAKKGLPCGLCGTPTNSILSHIFSCQHCGFSKKAHFPHGKESEDPTYCDYCNP
jgi:hypothetical protein